MEKLWQEYPMTRYCAARNLKEKNRLCYNNNCTMKKVAIGIPDPDPGGQKMTNKNRKKVNKFKFLKCWIFFF
jgi:hypothetical protein